MYSVQVYYSFINYLFILNIMFYWNEITPIYLLTDFVRFHTCCL